MRQGEPGAAGFAKVRCVDARDIESDLTEVLFSSDAIQSRLGELAADIEADYSGRDLLLVGVLNGAIMVMADLSRALTRHCEMDWMAISSYGSGTQSSGVVRILKDLNTELAGRHVLVVEDIVDTGLTLAYLIQNLKSRGPASEQAPDLFRFEDTNHLFTSLSYSADTPQSPARRLS